jgi:hypothetical protein
MRKPVRHSTSPRKRTAGFHRLARLLALVAMLLNQPLAAVHAVTDEAHLAHGVAHPAHVAGTPQDDAGHRHEVPPHPDDLHQQTCQVCLLVGSALLPSGSVKLANAEIWHYTAGPAIQARKTERRLRVGDPARAPPAVHPI